MRGFLAKKQILIKSQIKTGDTSHNEKITKL